MFNTVQLSNAVVQKPMGQVSIYLDDDMLDKIKKASEMSDVSVSKWIRTHLNESLKNQYPEGYFELYGSLAEADFQRPEQVPFEEDTPREPL